MALGHLPSADLDVRGLEGEEDASLGSLSPGGRSPPVSGPWLSYDQASMRLCTHWLGGGQRACWERPLKAGLTPLPWNAFVCGFLKTSSKSCEDLSGEGQGPLWFLFPNDS